ncbi:MAG: hypothetical protein ABEN55_03560, partial [Bradymonadaceae bacterium]
DFDTPELAVENRTLCVRDGQPDDRPTDPSGGGGQTAESPSTDESPSEPTGTPSRQPVRAERDEPAPAAADGGSRIEPETISEAADQFPTEPILVEADQSAAYDPIQLKKRLDGQRIVILAGPMLVTNMMRRATERCGARVLVLEDSGDRNPLESDETVCDLFDEDVIESKFDDFGPVDGVINLLGFGQEKYEGETVRRAARQSFHAAKAWQNHLGGRPGDGSFWVT